MTTELLDAHSSTPATEPLALKLNEGLGPLPERDDLGWHALNYRTAHTLHAEAMWQELLACVERRVAAERERCAQICRDHAADKHPPFKAHEDRYMDGWLDAANECEWAIHGPNVRAKRAATAGRQARAGEDVPRTARPGLVACRWRSA